MLICFIPKELDKWLAEDEDDLENEADQKAENRADDSLTVVSNESKVKDSSSAPSDELKSDDSAVKPYHHPVHHSWPMYNGMHHSHPHPHPHSHPHPHPHLPHPGYHHYHPYHYPYHTQDYHSNNMHTSPLYPTQPTGEALAQRLNNYHSYRSSAPYGHFGRPLFMASHSHIPPHQYIKKITDTDVICGRGGAVHNHPGNKSFRELIQKFKHQYLNETKQKKPMVAMRVIHMVKKSNPPGR